MESSNTNIQAGSFMAYGLINSGITNEMDPVSAVLVEKLQCDDDKLKIGALMGLSFTYAGSAREDLLEEITPIILDSDNSTQLQAVASLAIGLIYVGTCNEDACQSILQTLMEKQESDIDSPFSRLFCLGLGLLFLGQQSLAEATIECLGVLENEKWKAFSILVVETCAYAGSGNVLKIQKLLHICAEHKTEEQKDETIHQVAAVLGVALISFGEDIG